MQSFLEHRKMRIREGLSDCSILEGIDHLIELLRLDLREKIEINAPLTEDIFRGKEVEKILREDLAGGKSYIRGLTALLRQYLPTAIYNEVMQATASQGYKTAADAIGDEIDGFVQNVKAAVEKHLNMRASGGDVQGQPDPNVVTQPSHRMGQASGPPPVTGAPAEEPIDADVVDDGSGIGGGMGGGMPPMSGAPAAGGKKGPGFWQGLKNLWRNIVWNPLKKAWTTGPNESTEAIVALIRESNSDILASIDQWGADLRNFVVGKLPDIAQMGSQMSPDELAGLGNMGSEAPTPEDRPTDPTEDPLQQQAPPDNTLPADTDNASPDNVVPSDAAPESQPVMNQGMPDETGEAPAAQGSKRIPVPKAKRELAAMMQEEVPDFNMMPAKKQSSVLMRKIFDHAGLGASHISDPAKLANRISDRLSQFNTWLPKSKRQDPSVEMEPFKLIPGSWGHNRDIIVQLAHAILVQGESLPEAIEDVAEEMPNNPDSEPGSLTGGGAPTMDDPVADIAAGPDDNGVEVQPPKMQDDTTLPSHGTEQAPEDSPAPDHVAREILARIKKRHGEALAAQQAETGHSDDDIIGMITSSLADSNPMDVEKQFDDFFGEGEPAPEEPAPEEPAATSPMDEPSPVTGDENPFDNLQAPEPTGGLASRVADRKKKLDDVEIKHHDGGASIGTADDLAGVNDEEDDLETEPRRDPGDDEWDQIVGNDEDAEEFPEPVDDSDDLEKSPEELARMQQDAEEADEYRKKLAQLSADNQASGNMGPTTTSSSTGNWEVGSKPTAGNVSKAAKQVLAKLNQQHSGDMGDLIDSEVDQSGLGPDEARDAIERKVADIIRGGWDSSYAYGAPMEPDEVLDALRSGGGDFGDEDDDFDPIAHARDEEEELRRREHVSNLRSKLFAEKTAPNAS